MDENLGKNCKKMGDTNWNNTTNGQKFEKMGDTKWIKKMDEKMDKK